MSGSPPAATSVGEIPIRNTPRPPASFAFRLPTPGSGFVCEDPPHYPTPPHPAPLQSRRARQREGGGRRSAAGVGPHSQVFEAAGICPEIKWDVTSWQDRAVCAFAFPRPTRLPRPPSPLPRLILQLDFRRRSRAQPHPSTYRDQAPA